MRNQIKVLGLFLFFHNTIAAQTIFTYGNNQTSKTEFLRAYNKNKITTDNKENALKEYLELYSNFKIKVKAAQDLGLDTLEQIKYDVKNFRDQIVDNYLNDNNSMQALINEAADRNTKDIHAVYFFVPITASQNDSNKIFEKNAEIIANNIYKNVAENNNAGYTNIVNNFSNNDVKVKFGDVGFITTFSVNYDFENIIYNTKIGTYSKPYYTTKGFYIFKPVSSRPAAGKWNVAQILFSFPPDADASTKKLMQKKADSVYTLIKNGMPFGEAAQKFSDDRATYQAGGVLPEFGTGKYKIDFEEKVFALKKDNDITNPFETAYGIHMVKRISRKEIPTDENDYAYQNSLKQMVSTDSRINKEKEIFAKNITAETGFQKTIKSEQALLAAADSLIKNPANKNVNKLPVSKTNIATFKDKTKVTGLDYITYVANYTSNPENLKLRSKQLLDNFFTQAILNFYKQNLENYNSEFKYQLQEFKEGNMLFEIMERNVWSKSGSDSIALQKYYEAHKENYKWGASADVIVFNCTDEAIAKKAMDDSKAGISFKIIAEKSDNKTQVDSGRYELLQINNYKTTNAQPNAYSPIIINTDGSASFVKYLKMYNGNVTRDFADARGLVINDYQNVLEKTWIENLRKKYPVKYNDQVINEILK